LVRCVRKEEGSNKKLQPAERKIRESNEKTTEVVWGVDRFTRRDAAQTPRGAVGKGIEPPSPRTDVWKKNETLGKPRAWK